MLVGWDQGEVKEAVDTERLHTLRAREDAERVITRSDTMDALTTNMLKDKSTAQTEVRPEDERTECTGKHGRVQRDGKGRICSESVDGR